MLSLAVPLENKATIVQQQGNETRWGMSMEGESSIAYFFLQEGERFTK